MKIAIVVIRFPEVSETFIINKVLALAAKGNQVTVYRSFSTDTKALENLYQFSANKNINIKNLPAPVNILSFLKLFIQHFVTGISCFSLQKRKFYQQFINALLIKEFNKYHYDIVHIEFSGIAVSLQKIITQLNAKTVVSCRGSAEKVKPLTEPNRIEGLSKAINSVDAVHCVSADMQQTIMPWCKDVNKIFINRPAIDPSFFTPQQIPNNTVKQILSIGRFTFQKGYLTGLLAVKKLVEKGYNFHWNIIGDGPNKEEIIFHIHTLGLQKQVNLLGKKNKHEVNEWLAKSDFFLLTSVYEGIPNVALEAMAMEKPVVTTKSGGIDEVIEHGKDGFIAPLYDVDTIAEQLEYLLNNPQIAVEVGKNARQKILADYTLERQVNVFMQAYQQLIQA